MGNRFASGVGIVGATLLLTTPLTYLFTAPAPWVAAAKAGLGLILLVAFVVLRRRAGQPWSAGVGNALLAIVALAAVVALNLWARHLQLRVDLTQGKIHSLAPQTQSVLETLPESVEVIAWVPADHPVHDALEALLDQFRVDSKGKLAVRFDDSSKNPQGAAALGLRPGEMAVLVQRGDQARTALGAVSEGELTQALLRVSRSRGLKAYFVQGHDEPPPELEGTPSSGKVALRGFSRSLVQEGFSLDVVSLASEVPPQTDVLVVSRPATPYSATEAEHFAQYLEQGGHAVLFLEPNQTTGLEDVLLKWGVILDPGVVAEPPPPGVENPYVILTSSYGEHSIARALRQGNLAVQLVTARALTLLRQGLPDGVKVEPVVFSGPSAWEESQADASPQPGSGEKAGRLTLAAASTRSGPAGRSPQTRLFVLGEADLIRDVLWGNEANRNLVLSAISWAAEPNDSAIAIRPLDRDASSLELAPAALARLRFITADLVPLLILAAAVFLSRSRRSA